MALVAGGLLAASAVVAGTADAGKASASGNSQGNIGRTASELDASLGRGSPSDFAGLWIDGNQQIHVSLINETAASNTIIKQYQNQASLLVTTGARYSIQYLESLRDRIAADPNSESGGTSLVTVGPDVYTNTVRVGLAPNADNPAPILADFPGEPITVSTVLALHTMVGRVQNALGGLFTLQGGVAITGGGFECTSAVVAGQGTNTKILMTAGHCFTTGTQVSENNVIIGTVQAQYFGGNVDAEAINVNNVVWQPTSCVYTTANCGQNVFQGYAPSVGSNDCKRGIMTGYECGHVTYVNQTVNIRDDNGNIHTLTGQDLMDQCSIPGDSGGPHLDGGVSIEGMTSAGTACGAGQYTTFTPMPTSLQATGSYLPYNP